MSSSVVPSDNSLISRIDRLYLSVEKNFTVLSGVIVFALICLATINVLGRKLLNLPLPGFVDWVEQCMIVIAFAGLSYCQREGSHVRMEVLIGKLHGRNLWRVELISTIVLLLIATVLIYGTWFHFLRSFDWGAPNWSRDSTIDIGLPIWPAKLLVPVCLSLFWIRLLLQVWGYARALKLKSDRPVAVPTMQTVSEQAATEVEGWDESPK